MTASWRTTTAGLVALALVVALAAVHLLDGDPATGVPWEVVAPVIATAIGLLAARDNKVTSEQARCTQPPSRP